MSGMVGEMAEAMVAVSVIVPVYNVEKYLRKCLDGILSQTLKDMEVIAVDDGSTDSSPSILREYAKKDGRIRVVSRQNGGAGAARNTGLALARGKYLFFHDPDDFSAPRMLERLVANAERYNSDVVVAGRMLYDNAARAESSARVAQKKIDTLVGEISRLRNSEAYRTGMFVTWPARKAWGGVKCLRENGVKYTAKHAVGKVLRFFGSNCKW